MKNPCPITSWDRRQFVTKLGLGAAAFLTPGAFAESLQLTPKQTEGPFFPDQLPLDTDNDLLIVNDGLTPAVGQITHLSGTVKDIKGNPVRNALVEIWQVDGNGVYLHSRAPKENQDRNFQGYGRFSTDGQGRYYFRTVKPVPYPGRTPHIHVAITQGGQRTLTSQCYLAGEAANQRDGLYQRLSPEQQKRVTVAFTPLAGSANNELSAHWELVVGLTPQD